MADKQKEPTYPKGTGPADVFLDQNGNRRSALGATPKMVEGWVKLAKKPEAAPPEDDPTAGPKTGMVKRSTIALRDRSGNVQHLRKPPGISLSDWIAKMEAKGFTA